MMLVMGIDPGVTTGWAILDCGQDGEVGLSSCVVVECGQLNGAELLKAGMADEVPEGGMYREDRAVAMALYRLIDAYQPDAVYVEDFVLRPSGIGSSGRDGVSPLRIICFLECWLFDIGFADDDVVDYDPGLAYNTPADAKKVITDQRLRAAGLWVRGQQHARDAIRHAALGYRKEKGRK